MNGGVYMDSTAAVTMNRLGVEQITLPTPERTGYIFKDGKVQTESCITKP